MKSIDQDKQMIEDQYDQILRLKHRLTITTCVAFIAIAALVGVSFLFSVSIIARGNPAVTAQQEAMAQRNLALQMQRQAQLAQQNAAAAQAALMNANRRMLEAQRQQTERDSEPVVAPVPRTRSSPFTP